MLYIDCGHTAACGHYTGIQRYVRRTLRHAQALLGHEHVSGLHAQADGWSCLAQLPTHPLEGLPPVPLAQGKPDFGRDSHVLLADRFWHTGAWSALDALLASDAQITLVVYDLLSLDMPHWFPPGVGERFERYLRCVLPRAQRIVCLCASVQARLAAWMHAQGLSGDAAMVVAPGHQVWTGEPIAPCLPATWRDGRTPFVLQVGTLEPRKNHRLTLNAMQRQWRMGRNLGCLFIGQHGWMMQDLIDSMARMPQWNHQLFWLPECTDAQLQWCYGHARAVLYPSSNEGYGLPLAEAAGAGAQVIASDTEVHRQVAASLGALSSVRLCELSQTAFDAALDQSLAHERLHGGTTDSSRPWQLATAELLSAMGLGPAVRVDRACHFV